MSTLMVCNNCGSPNVVRDAWAKWSVELQQWEIGDVFDFGMCEDCEDEKCIEEVECEPGQGQAFIDYWDSAHEGLIGPPMPFEKWINTT